MPLTFAIRRVRGFTLIELMIAVAIVSILLAVAMPSFLGSMRKSRRSDAVSALQAVALAQERFRTNNATYAANLNNPPSDTTTPGLGLPSSTPNQYYVVSLSDAPTATSYWALASPVSGKSQASDGDCAYLRVRMSGGAIFYGSSASSDSNFDESTGNRCWSK